MKKYFNATAALLICVALALALVSCGDSGRTDGQGTAQSLPGGADSATPGVTQPEDGEDPTVGSDTANGAGDPAPGGAADTSNGGSASVSTRSDDATVPPDGGMPFDDWSDLDQPTDETTGQGSAETTGEPVIDVSRPEGGGAVPPAVTTAPDGTSKPASDNGAGQPADGTTAAPSNNDTKEDETTKDPWEDFMNEIGIDEPIVLPLDTD